MLATCDTSAPLLIKIRSCKIPIARELFGGDLGLRNKFGSGGGDSGSFSSAVGDEDSSVDDADNADDDEDEDSGFGNDDEVGVNVGDEEGELVMIVIARLVLETRSDFLFLTVPVHLQTVKRKRTSEYKNFPPKQDFS